MRGRTWPTGSAVQRGACTCCRAVGCISFPAEQLQGRGPALFDREGPGIAATPCQRIQSVFFQARVDATAAVAGHHHLPSSPSQPPERVLAEPQTWQQLKTLHGSTRMYEVIAALPRGHLWRTAPGFRLVAIICFSLLLVSLKLFQVPPLPLTTSYALQLRLASRPDIPLSHCHSSTLGGALRAASDSAAGASSPALKRSVQPLASSGILRLAHINPRPCSSSPAQSADQRFPRPVVAAVSPPSDASASPTWSELLRVRRLDAAASGRGVGSLCSPVIAKSLGSSSAADIHVTAFWNSISRARTAQSAIPIAHTPRCIAHVRHVAPLLLRILPHTYPPFYSGPGSDASDPLSLPATSTAHCVSAAAASAGLALSAGGSCDGQWGCKGLRREVNHIRLRCTPAGSLLASSFSPLRWTRTPADKMLQDEQAGVKASACDGSLSLIKQQLQQQVQQHQPEIRSLLRGLLQMTLQCLRSMWGVYFLGLYVLIMPLCASARPYLELINRVPLNDPYFLRHLNLPEDASPALYGLPFYEVKVPPLLFPGSFASESRTTSTGRPGGGGAAAASSTWVSGLPGASQPAEPVSAKPAAVETAPTPGISNDNVSPEVEHGTLVCEDNGQEDALGPDGEAPVFNWSNDSNAVTGGFLRGWLIPAEQQDSRKAIICAHGWLANRQACLPFLNIARKVGLHKDHHIFLFDLKSSGESSSFSARPRNRRWQMDKPRSRLNKCSRPTSPSAEDQLGCQATEDFLQAILYLRKTCGITNVSLYAQGVSAMGAMVLLSECRDQLQREWGITIDKVIFDSPVCSARDALQTQPLASCLAKTAAWLYEVLMWTLTKQRGRQLRRLRASRLLRTGKPYKLLIFSSREDNLAPWTSVRHEMLQLPEQNRPDFICVFPTGSHCDLARQHQLLYTDVIQNFYAKPSFGQSIWRKLAGVHSPVADPNVEIFTPRDLSAADASGTPTESEQHIEMSRRRLSAAVLSLLNSLSSIERSREQTEEEENWNYK